MSVAFGSGEGFSRNYLDQIIMEAAREQEALQRAEDIPKLDYLPKNLNCPALPGSYPTSVHRLRPQDVEIIGAIGDSLTVGLSILTLMARKATNALLYCLGCKWSQS